MEPEDIKNFRKSMENMYEGKWAPENSFFDKLNGFDSSNDIIIVDFSLTNPKDTVVMLAYNGFLMDYDYNRRLTWVEDVKVKDQTLKAALVRRIGKIIKNKDMSSYGIGVKALETFHEWNDEAIDVENNIGYLVRLSEYLGIGNICIVDIPGLDLSRIISQFQGKVNIQVVPGIKSQESLVYCMEILRQLLRLRYFKIYRDSLLYKTLCNVQLRTHSDGKDRFEGHLEPLAYLAATICLSFGVTGDGKLFYRFTP